MPLTSFRKKLYFWLARTSPIRLQELRRTLPEVGQGEGTARCEVVLLTLREILPELRPHRLDGVQIPGVRREVHEDEAGLAVCLRLHEEPLVVLPHFGLGPAARLPMHGQLHA